MEKLIKTLNDMLTIRCAIVGAAMLAGSLFISSLPAMAASEGAPAAAVLPPSTCAFDSVAGKFTCDLWAMTGTVTLPGATMPITIWGYAATSAGPAALPGPTLIVTQGAAVDIVLHNVNLPSATSLLISDLPMIPDTTGVTSSNSKTYTFTANTAGTYLYEAGLTPDGPRQVAMGLYGALIVRPSACITCAYDASSAFDDEALVILSEIDPAFNAAPATYDMTGFAPKFWLINGNVYPNTTPITSEVSHTVLLRYVNAGLMHHSMTLNGLHQTIIATDARVAANRRRVVAQTIPAGGTLDTLVTMPASGPANAKYALFEAAMHEDNNGTTTGGVINFGGMLTFITTVSATTTFGGPVVSSVGLSPNPSDGAAPVTLTATITPSTGATVDAAEYFVDALGANGAGCAISGSLTNVIVIIPVSGATSPCADLTTLSSGNHIFYVHGHDTSGVGTWGAVASGPLNLDKLGPVISNMGLTPNDTNGTADVQLQATASDAATGNHNVIAAEFAIDGGAVTTFTIALPATSVSLNATVPAATVSALGNGNHTVVITAQDALGNWGAAGTIILVVDKIGPITSGVTASPNPTNDLFGVQSGTTGGYFVRIDATTTDPLVGGVQSNIAAAEFFIDTTGANGFGGAMLPTMGAFTTPTLSVYGLLPMYAMAQYAQGQHIIYVHGKDAAGNWETTYSTSTLIVDKTKPIITATLSPATSPSPANLTLVLTATDPVNTATPPIVSAPASNVIAAEWFVGVDPGVGLGNAMTLLTAPGTTASFSATVSMPALLPPGSTFTVTARAMDAAHNWSVVVMSTVTVTAPVLAGFETGNFIGFSGTGGALGRIAVTAGVAQAGQYKMEAQISGDTSGYVLDKLPANLASYHAHFYVNRDTLTIGPNSTGRDIFVGLNAANQVIFRVQVRRNGTTYQVGATVTHSGGTSSTNWFNLGSGYQAIEIYWQTGITTSFSFYTSEVVGQTLTGLNTSAFALNEVRLGPQGTLTGDTGTMLFDSFVSAGNLLVAGPKVIFHQFVPMVIR